MRTEVTHVSLLGQPAPKCFGDVLQRILKAKSFWQKGRYGPLAEAWDRMTRELLGEEVAGATRVGEFRHGRVTIETDSPILLQELGGFLCQRLLERLRTMPAGRDVRELRFRLGRGGPTGPSQGRDE